MFGYGFSAAKMKPRKYKKQSSDHQMEFQLLLILTLNLHGTHLFVLPPSIELKMAVSRFQITSNKKSSLMKQQMREIAVMLSEDPPKEEKAKIRAESLIREDNAVEAYEILQLECELLAERIKLIDSSKECPPDLVSCVSTLIWACDRVDIGELAMIRKQFRAKYGKQFEEAALTNMGGRLNERVVSKLSVQPPAAYLVQVYLERICEQFEVNWKPKQRLTAEQMSEPMAAPVGYSVQVAPGTGLGEVVVGQLNTDEEIGLPSKMDIPAPFYAPSAPGSVVVPATAYVPAATYIPPQAPSANLDFEEVDIFVPAIPTAPAGSGAKKQDEKKDDDDDDASGPAVGGSEMNTSFANLAARFESLKK